MKNTIFYISVLFFLNTFSTKTFGQDPNWSVNPSGFQLSMTFTTFLNVNGVKLTATNDKVAAFVNGEVRGVGNIRFVATAGKHVAYLTVFANTNLETIRFKVYDSNSGDVVDIVKTESFRFNVNLGTLFQSYSLANPALNAPAILNDFNFQGITPNSKTQSGNTFNFVMPIGTNVTNLIPVFTNSARASVFVNQIKQISGVSVVNFSNSKTYAVVSQDEATLENYTINVSVAVNQGATTTVISSTANANTNEIPVPINVQFSNAISGFNREDVQLSNAVILGFTKIDNQHFTLQIVPISDGDFSVSIVSGAALNENNKPTVGSNSLSFSFDETRPIITNLVLDKVAGNEFFTITFSEEIVNASMTDFELTGTLADAYLKSSLIPISSKIYRLNVSKLNNKIGTVFLKVKSDSNIIDNSGNRILLQETASFYLDNTAPEITVYSPESFATSEITKLQITFSETVFVNTGNIKVYKSSDNSLVASLPVTGANVSLNEVVVAIELVDNLAFNEAYYVLIDPDAFKDSANNNFAGILNITDWSFRVQVETANYKQFSGAWSNAANWSLGRLPIITDNVFVASATTGFIDITDLEVNNFTNLGTTEIAKTTAVIVNGDFTNSGILTINSDAADSGVLLVRGSSTGSITYHRGGLVANRWSVIAPPLKGQKVIEFAQAVENEIRVNATVDPVKYAIGYYNDANVQGSKWQYFNANTNESIVLDRGTGYAMSRKTDGIVSFTGTLEQDDIQKGVIANQWNAIGNSFISYYPMNKNGNTNFLRDNDFKLEIPSVYIWNSVQEKYVSVNNLVTSDEQFIGPAQGFFIKSNRLTTLRFDANKRSAKSSSSAPISNKSSRVIPFVKIYVEKGTTKVNTAVIFSQTATRGFDKSEDIPNFGGASFDINSHLLEGSEGANYTTQSIPSEDINNIIIPIHLKATANDELIFSVKITDFSADIEVYLEDKETNTVIRLDEQDSEYKITLTENNDGIGRFYLHSSSKALSTDAGILKNISIVNLNNNTLRIMGLNEEKAALKIYDILGKEVFKVNFEGTTVANDVQLTNLKPALYLAVLTTKKGKINKKIIIE